MPDREKVIKELEWQINVFTSYCASDDRHLEAMKAALALLKEHDAVGPKWASGIKGADALCGSCMAWLSDHSWGYCPRCGRAVKWE